MNIILIILVFGIIVFFHEFGHFIVAKINKIKVSEFSIGMGPAIFSFGKGDTKYFLRLLPLGGYCLMLGEDEEIDDENAFSNKSVLTRLLVIAAGPVFNFILAFLFSIILINQTGCDPAVLYQVVDRGPAYEAGIEPGDKIIEIDGDKIYNYRELTLYMELNGKHNPVISFLRAEEVLSESLRSFSSASRIGLRLSSMLSVSSRSSSISSGISSGKIVFIVITLFYFRNKHHYIGAAVIRRSDISTVCRYLP